MKSYSARRLVRGTAVLLAATLVAAVWQPVSAQERSGSARVSATASTQGRSAGQVRPLSLAEALELAERQSESLRIAEAGLMRSRGQLSQARSGYFPQLTATAGYQRTLQSQFQEIFESGGSEPAEPTEPGGGDGLEDSPITQIFASENTVTLGLQFTQNLWTGGRLSAMDRAARAGRSAAEIEVASQRAQVRLDVTEAYYDALLADRLLAIADSSLIQTERTLRQAQLGYQVGTQSEFEMLRASVTRDNQRPQLVQARAMRETAYLRLAQMLELPLDEPLNLTTPIEEGVPQARQLAEAGAEPQGVPTSPVSLDVDVEAVLAPDPVVVALVDSIASLSDTSTEARSIVRQAGENLVAQQAMLKAARAQRWPALQLQSLYQRFAYPVNSIPGWNNYYPNWTVSVGLSVPILSGGRIRGEILAAEAAVVEARESRRQAEEAARLDARLAIAALEQAAESYAASRGTEQQALRAYGIAELRFAEGISSQMELNDSRLLLQQAQANQAQAARDLAVARMRLLLLADLPLGATSAALRGGPSSGGAAGSGAPAAGQPTAAPTGMPSM